MRAGQMLENPKPFNRIINGLWMAVKVLLVLIYGCGFHVEKLLLFVAKPLYRFITGGWFRGVCAVGEWVIATAIKLARGTAHLGVMIANSFVHDFSWWAPCIGAACFIAVLVVSNFFSVALEVSINDNVVGYVTTEQEYQNILNQVEADIQVQLDQNATADTNAALEVPTTKEQSDQKQNVVVNATQQEDSEEPTVSSLNLEGESYAMTTTTKYNLSFVRKSDLATEEDLYTGVYSAVSELVGNNYGLYVDGQLKAACADEAAIQKVLDEVKAPYASDESNTRIEFVEDVVVKKGMFASDTLKTEEELRAMFRSDSDQPAYYVCEDGDYMSTVAEKFGMTTAQLKALNPNVKETEIYEGRRLNIAAPDIYLQVKTVKTLVYEDEIAFSVIREKNSDMYVNTTKVKTAGVNGVKRITAEVTYVDGKQISKTIVDTEVIKEPVNKVIYVGTKKRASYSSSSSGSSGYVSGNYVQGSGKASGNFRCPLPGAYVSCGWYGYSGHRAVDLCLRGGTLNAAVYAADGGTVEYSGWSGGYGNLIRIRHSNGYVTYYAHLNARYVSAGDKVSKGQMIGRAGSTGNSTGPHLHFEIRYNGTPVNPLNYISV